MSTAPGAFEYQNNNKQQQHHQQYPQYSIQSTYIADQLDYEMLLCMSNLIEMSDTNVDHFFSRVEFLLKKQKNQKNNKNIKTKEKEQNHKNQKKTKK